MTLTLTKYVANNDTLTKLLSLNFLFDTRI